jgi:hypothetical protein
MLYKGNRLHLDQLRKVFSNLEDATIKMWQANILLGLDIYLAFTGAIEDLINTDVEYSFLSDNRNKCFASWSTLI